MRQISSEICVLIPHYNNPEGLIKSLKSISETENIDVLVIDDGSKNAVLDEDLIRRDIHDNIHLEINYLPENLGIEGALNFGLGICANKGYSFIARLDCGDICAENRFKIQFDFLKANPDYGIVGSSVDFFNTDGEHCFDLQMPSDDELIRKRMFLNAMFIHPTVMFRKEVLDETGYYPTEFPAAEDYAFFFQILQFYKGANIEQKLVSCELNPNGISIQRRKQQIKSRIQLILKYFYPGLWPVYGLLRNIMLFIIPNRLIIALKSKLN